MGVTRGLQAAERASPGEAVDSVTASFRRALGATDVAVFMVDLSGRGLVRLARDAEAVTPPPASSGRGPVEPPALVPDDDGAVKAALVLNNVQLVRPGDPRLAGLPAGWLVLAPLTERGDALGLLAVTVAEEPGAALLQQVEQAARTLAYVVIADRRHTDRFEWTQRSEAFTLPAEIQRRLLPASLTCESPTFTLSAWLEPAAEVGGDTFDYSVERHVLHLSMTDAMGHGVGSALTATLCVGSLRNTRRGGATLLQQVSTANAAMVRQAETTAEEGFVTGLFGRVHLDTGVLTMVNAGHVAPYLARGDAVRRVELPIDLPLGMFAESGYRTTDVALEPGDRVVLVTDGMLERKASALDLVQAIVTTRAMHPREASRHLADGVLGVTGPDLDDDATLLVLDWHGPNGHSRHAARADVSDVTGGPPDP